MPWKKKINFKREYVALCSFIIGGTCTFLYGINETAKYLDQVVNTEILKLKKKSEYIYLNDVDLELEYFDDTNDRQKVMKKFPSLSDWWERKKKLFLWRLVEIANDSNETDRRRSLEILASYRNLHDYEYYQLSLACNARTTVALARIKNVDQRFFRRTLLTCKCKSHGDLVNAMRDLLVKLCKTSRHPCLHYFISKVFPKLPKYKAWSFFSDLDVYGFVCVPPTSISESNILPLCVDALVHHCSASGDAKSIVEKGGLQLLFDCRHQLFLDCDACYRLSSIIAEVSTDPNNLQDLYQTGWVGVMAEWLSGPDYKLSTAAATALANLDAASGGSSVSNTCVLGSSSDRSCYKAEVVLLHPTHCGPTRRQPLLADVVLIHGLLGGVHYTWRQRGPRKEPISIFGMVGSDESKMEQCAKRCSLAIDEAPQEAKLGDRHLSGGTGEDLNDLPESEYVFVMTDIPETESFCCNTNCSIEGNNLEKFDSMQSAEFTMCWPKDWLPQDCKNLRVIGINYDTKITDWTNWCPLRDRKYTRDWESSNRLLAERCKKLLSHLVECGIGERPVIWITHSMGGLILKHLLVQAWNSPDENSKKISENTKGAVFLSTPHIGSPWATLHEVWKFFFWPSTEVDELRYQSPVLQKLHKEFLKFVEEHPIEIVSFVETKGMKISEFEWEFHCVPPTIGDTGTGIIYGIPLGHLDICKPDGKYSFIYQRILSLVRSMTEKSQTS